MGIDDLRDPADDLGVRFRDLVDARWRRVAGVLVPLLCLGVVVGGVIKLDGAGTDAPARGTTEPTSTTIDPDLPQVLGVAITQPPTTPPTSAPYVPPAQADLDGPSDDGDDAADPGQPSLSGALPPPLPAVAVPPAAPEVPATAPPTTAADPVTVVAPKG